MRRALREVLMSVGTVAILLLMLIAFDDRVRDRCRGASSRTRRWNLEAPDTS